MIEKGSGRTMSVAVIRIQIGKIMFSSLHPWDWNKEKGKGCFLLPFISSCFMLGLGSWTKVELCGYLHCIYLFV